jgi:hypothetical protein
MFTSGSQHPVKTKVNEFRSRKPLPLRHQIKRPDNDANKDLYGKKIDATDIAPDATVKPPPSASTLISTLDKAWPVNKSTP